MENTAKLNHDIYKFCSFEIAVKIVSNRELKFNNPANFNDPFDCDINLLKFDFSECSDEILIDIEKSKDIVLENPIFDVPGYDKQRALNKIITREYVENEYKRIQNKKKEISSICCFSLDYMNTTMWSHYADKHRGICLVFALADSCPLENEIYWKRMNMSQVYYTNLMPVNYLKSKEEAIKNLFFTKSNEWSYENEWRMFILEDVKFMKFKPEFLKGVIFGANVSEDEILRFKKLFVDLDYKKVYFGRMIKENLGMSSIDIT
jgi:hypothetical protein